MRQVRTEAGNKGKMLKVVIWKNNSYYKARERMDTYRIFYI